MKIVILGGGLTGLTAAYELSSKHEVVLLEKENMLGGLASGFKGGGWNWFLERTYHHVFSNDTDILGFAKKVGFTGFFTKSPQTVSLYNDKNNYRTFSVDTPQDFLRFPLLSIPEKIRSGAVLAFLKLSPALSSFERQTAAEFLKKSMGERVWSVLWEELFRKKFGKNAENILASFIWARIKKRTKNLCYVEGGFQAFVEFLRKKNIERGVVIKTGSTIHKIHKSTKFEVSFSSREKGEERGSFDAVLSTLPTPVFLNISRHQLPDNYVRRLAGITYLHAVSLILEAERPLFDTEYWVSMCDKKAPMMVLVQHTNFIDKKNYNNHHILYIANYVEEENPLLQMTQKEVEDYHVPYLQKIKAGFSFSNSFLFRAPFAQPIYNREFPKNMPTLETPVKNLFIANLDMTYPFDRGTNYAVQLGKKAASCMV